MERASISLLLEIQITLHGWPRERIKRAEKERRDMAARQTYGFRESRYFCNKRNLSDNMVAYLYLRAPTHE